jgi:hypothetical protein
VLAGFHHADEEPIKHTRMFGNRFVESFAALHTGGDVADDVAQAFLTLGIALVVKGGQRLDQRDARLDHRRELAGEEDKVGFFDGPGFLPDLGDS